MLSHGAIKHERALNGVLRGKLAAPDLDQRDKVRRIEGVAENDALRMSHARILEFANGNCRRAGGKRRIRRRCLIQPTKQITLDIEALGTVLLDEVDIGYGVFRRRYEPQTLGRRSG